MDKLYEFERDPLFKYYEKIPTQVFDTSVQASINAAEIIRDAIFEKKQKGQKCVLGLATGSTPIRVYEELKRMHREEGLSFQNVVTFNLDEYYPMQPESLQSYFRFMKENLFDEIDIPKENIHVPNGTIKRDQIEDYCMHYEQLIKDFGGIDVQLLGIGKTGHIGFNEPGSSRKSKTRLIYLDKITQTDAASDFFGLENVPMKAITMGIDTILKAKKIIIMAFSETKADIVQKAVEGHVTSEVPASYLQEHNDTVFLMDRAASESLTRFRCPWTIKGVTKQLYLNFDDYLKKKAIIWLSQTLGKSISKLVADDYEMNGLYQIIEEEPDIQKLNHKIMDQLASKITEYPAGKDSSPKKILIFSPHPDDDVICMAGTMRRLSQQGHEVHVAYQTSGNIGVFDHDALRFANFLAEAGKAFNFSSKDELINFEQRVKDTLAKKKHGESDNPEVLEVKALIRQTEALSAAISAGTSEKNVYFLDLPFYETGKVKKKPVGPEDVRIVKELMNSIKPDHIYAAGDLTDPHGTHRSCLVSILKAFNQLEQEASPWFGDCKVYLYRGAWQEWEIEKVTMAVPLNPEEVLKKRQAVFRHQSQKDKALFPGFDSREFWQRAEERNKRTAHLYNTLGLPEFEAMEVFVELKELTRLFKNELNNQQTPKLKSSSVI